MAAISDLSMQNRLQNAGSSGHQLLQNGSADDRDAVERDAERKAHLKRQLERDAERKAHEAEVRDLKRQRDELERDAERKRREAEVRDLERQVENQKAEMEHDAQIAAAKRATADPLPIEDARQNSAAQIQEKSNTNNSNGNGDATYLIFQVSI